MAITVSILETNVFAALRAYILTLVTVPVIRTPVNRAAMPLGDFIALSPAGMRRLETNTDSYPTITTKDMLQPMEITIRVDCYGVTACDSARLIAATFRDEFAVDAFTASGFDIAPLYTTDALQMPVITGEDQYLERWTFEAVMQFNPVTTITSGSTSTPSVPTLINVITTYGA